ncbi:target of Nesh-SH3 isoform X12 [Sphaerodactylus townsendi]|uniref:target of Nesh-SH3 isoform X12 n=1 Tax=Sphaerodactylus townsendi TaxID=933632 RepID=UPI002027526F|nr:target of Nesh-SH3 isoform X12 [Sphaerodactylus townsendi]
MISRLVFLLFCGNISLNLGNAQKLPRVKRQSLKVQINATGDAVCLRYIRPSPSIKLEGFILGYGSSFFSNQYIPLPSDGKPYITEVDAEPRYLIAVRPAPVPNYRKSCSGQTKTPKPLQLVIGTLTPTSVFLSWGVLINPKHDWITMNNCANDRFYTVRYREKDKNKKWILQLCPTTETVVDNLKPNIIYEFGVKDNTDNGIWSKTLTHNTVGSYKIKENGYLQNNNKLPKIQTQLISVDPKAGSPVTMIKEVIKNITHRTQAKTTEKSPLAGPILVHLIVPDFNQAKQKQLSPFPEDMSERSKKILAENNTLQWPAESKTSEIQELSPQSQPDTTELDWESSRPTVSSVSGEPKSFLAHTESELESSKPRISSMAELPLDTLAPHKFPEFPKIHTPTLQTPRGKLASHEMQPVPSQPQTTAPKTTQTKLDPKVKHHLFSTKTTISPHILQTKPVLQTTTFRPQPPMTEREEEDQEPSKPKILFSPDVSQTKPDLETITFRPEKPKTTTAPKETRRVPARAKTSASPGITSTKPGSKGSRRVVSRAKTSPSPNVTQTKPASAVEYFFPNKSKPSPRPRILETKPALYQTTSQPLTIKPTLSSGHLKTTMAPKETKFIPSKPKTSGKPEISQTKPAPVETIPGSINLHIHVLNDPKDTSVPSKLPSRETTESPHVRTAFHKVYLTTAKPKTTDKSQTRSVIHKTTPAPGRTRTAGRAIWGDILTEQDITRLFSTSASASTNVSADSTVARKKSDSVATPPDPPRPPLAPAKPTPMRRKPLPPNTVTGKPGSSGNILMPRAPPLATASSVAKPMRPTVLVRTGSPKKPPTASASPDYSNTTVFSLQPTSETDIAGKPRYKGDHVRYMKKEGDVPCSITDTLQHFPKEEGDNKNALSPPNNPPTNLTVVTVEGCASFVVLDWEKPENDTVTEYKVVSTENGAPDGKDKSVITTNLTHSTVENLKPNTSYEFLVIPSNPLGEGPSSETKAFKTESADPRVNEQISMGKDAIWTEIKFNSDDYSECKGKQYVKRTWYKKFVGVQLCNSLRYKIYLSDSLAGKFYNIGDQRGHGEDHCQFVDSYFDGKTGQQLQPNQLATKDGFFRAFRQEPVKFGKIGAATHTNYVHWYECGTTIPGKW